MLVVMGDIAIGVHVAVLVGIAILIQLKREDQIM